MPARRFQPIGGDLSRVDCHLKRGPLTEALAGRGGLARVRKPRQTSLVTTSESKSLSQLPCQPCESTNPIIRATAIFKFSYLSIFFFLHLCSFTHSPTRDLLLSFAQRRIRISENAVSRSERDRPIMMTSSRSVLYIYIYKMERSAFIPGPQCPSFTSTGLGPSR